MALGICLKLILYQSIQKSIKAIFYIVQMETSKSSRPFDGVHNRAMFAQLSPVSLNNQEAH